MQEDTEEVRDETKRYQIEGIIFLSASIADA